MPGYCVGDALVESAQTTMLALLVGYRHAEFFRLEEGKNVDILCLVASVPRRYAAARYDQFAIGVEVPLGPHPLHERNPVEQLETHFTGPRADEQRAGTSRNPVDLVEQLPMSLLLPGDTAQRLP